MASKTAFVTGSDGFIGSHLVEGLVSAGYKVKALVYYNPFDSHGWLDSIPKEVSSQIEIVSGDIRDSHHMERLIEGVDVVFHLAALIGIPFSYVAPDLYIQTNVQGTLNILNAVRKWGRASMIHTSTSEVYGTAQFVPMTELHPINPQSPYAASKAAADHLALSYHRSFEVPVTVIRPFNTFGPRQSTRAVIPSLLSQLLSQPEVKAGLTTPTRDFTYVTDTAAGFIAAAKSPAAVGETVQLGSNFEISIADLIESIASIVGVKATVKSESDRHRPEKSEVHRLWADNAKAKKLLNWAPKFGGKEGFLKALAITTEWFREPSNLARYRAGKYTV